MPNLQNCFICISQWATLHICLLSGNKYAQDSIVSTNKYFIHLICFTTKIDFIIQRCQLPLFALTIWMCVHSHTYIFFMNIFSTEITYFESFQLLTFDVNFTSKPFFLPRWKNGILETLANNIPSK